MMLRLGMYSFPSYSANRFPTIFALYINYVTYNSCYLFYLHVLVLSVIIQWTTLPNPTGVGSFGLGSVLSGSTANPCFAHMASKSTIINAMCDSLHHACAVATFILIYLMLLHNLLRPIELELLPAISGAMKTLLSKVSRDSEFQIWLFFPFKGWFNANPTFQGVFRNSLKVCSWKISHFKT